MKLSHIALTFAVLLAAGTGSAYACNHDILCPEKWVWSDAEGTCVEVEPETS